MRSRFQKPRCLNNFGFFLDSDRKQKFINVKVSLTCWRFWSPYPVAEGRSSTDAKRQFIDNHYFVGVANARQPNLHFWLADLLHVFKKTKFFFPRFELRTLEYVLKKFKKLCTRFLQVRLGRQGREKCLMQASKVHMGEDKREVQSSI